MKKTTGYTDKNGRRIHVGDIVKIEGAYFKKANAYFYVEVDDETPCCSGNHLHLHKIGKTGKVSTAKDHLEFWPLMNFTNRLLDLRPIEETNARATIEIVDNIKNTEVVQTMKDKIKMYENLVKDLVEKQGFSPFEDYVKGLTDTIEFLQKHLKRITA